MTDGMKVGREGSGAVKHGWHGRSYDLGHMTFGDLVKAYLTYPAIQVYGGLAAASVAVAVLAPSGWRPVLAVPVVMAVYPLVWYLLHRFVLHGRFLYRSPATAALWKRVHFDHHQDPYRLEVLFGALWTTLPTVAVVTVPVGAVIAGIAGAATAFAAGLLITCVYEFVHCIQHLNFKPRSCLLRRLKARHLLHHFHDESGNYGITSFAVDRVCGTYYGNARERKRSPHVFNLGYDRAEAERYPWVADLTGAPPRDRPPAAPDVRRGEAS